MKCLRASPRVMLAATILATSGWAGCATHPMVEAAFEARTYTPARIAILPPAVFMVYDQYGDNDPQKNHALGQAVTQQTVGLMADELRRRGYDVNLQARWDGIYDGNGQILVAGSELAWLASSIVQFANSETGGGEGKMEAPAFIAPELARKVGWATQSDALMYVNMKGVAVSKGKRTAQIVGVVFFVVVVAAIIAILMAQNKGGGDSKSGMPAGTAGGGGTAVPMGAAAGGAANAVASGPGAPTNARVVAPVGRGNYVAPPHRGHVYRSSPRVSTHVGVGVMVPIGSDQHVHPSDGGQVVDEDELFAGDEIRVSMTLVSAHDGRVLWHIRDSVDVAPDKPPEVEAFVRKYMGLIPPSLAPGQPPAPATAAARAQ